MNPTPDTSMTFFEHLGELRSRLLKCCVALSIVFILTWQYCHKISYFLQKPLLNLLPESSKKLYYTGLGETFFADLKVAFFSAILLVIPYWLYQGWAFIAPGLYKNERKWFFPIMILSLAFFLLGILFAYYVVFPFTFQFFMEYNSDIYQPIIRISEYLSFVTMTLLTFGFVFQLPLVMIVLSLIGILKSTTVSKNRGYVVVVISIVSAIFSPPDVISMLIMMIPLIILLELSIWGMKLTEIVRKV